MNTHEVIVSSLSGHGVEEVTETLLDVLERGAVAPRSWVLEDFTMTTAAVASVVTADPAKLEHLPSDLRLKGILNHDAVDSARLKLLHDLHLGFPIGTGGSCSLVPAMFPQDDRSCKELTAGCLKSGIKLELPFVPEDLWCHLAHALREILVPESCTRAHLEIFCPKTESRGVIVLLTCFTSSCIRICAPVASGLRMRLWQTLQGVLLHWYPFLDCSSGLHVLCECGAETPLFKRVLHDVRRGRPLYCFSSTHDAELPVHDLV